MQGTAIAITAAILMAYVTFAGSSAYETVREDAQVIGTVQSTLDPVQESPNKLLRLTAARG
jgi:hypothetical protein